MNKSILLKSLHIYFFIYAMIFCGCQHTIKVQNEVKECTKGDLKNETIHSVAIKLPFLFGTDIQSDTTDRINCRL